MPKSKGKKMTEQTPEFIAMYPASYGRWMKKAPDFNRCCNRVSDGTGSSNQCARKNGNGPLGAYCKQHDPEAKAAKSEARYQEMRAKMAYNAKRQAISNERAKLKDEGFELLRKIATGKADSAAAADLIARWDGLE